MSDKASLVLVPGLSGRPHWDFPFLAPMLRRQFDVTEVSFDGLASPGLDSLQMAIEIAVAACPSPPVLVGFSLGAVLAARVSSPVACLVLVAGWLRPAPKLLAFADIWARLRLEGSTTLEQVSTFGLYSPGGWETARALPADATTDSLIALAALADLSSSPPMTSAPTLVIGCSHDEVATTHESRLLFGTIQDARYAEVRSGHAVSHERPAELLQLISSFAAAPARIPSGSIISEQTP